jgi:MYXO-CTERM domain-containing protein
MALPSVAEHAAPTIIYMNRMGGIYRPGDNDARTNQSSIPSRTSQVSPWNVSAAGWAEVMDCMTEQFARFNVVITDVDPGNVPHIESVVAGYPQDVGMGQGVGGVSPFTEDCGVIPNSIVFTFAGVYGTAYRDICETAAQEVSHSFGLDHEYQCKDPMTYLSGCGDKEFQDNLERCGEYSARTCWCGGTTQNSVAMLRARLGPRETPDNDDVLASDEVAVAVADEDPEDGDGAGDGDSDGDGNGDTITGGCATAGGTGGGFVLLGIALVALRRRRSL